MSLVLAYSSSKKKEAYKVVDLSQGVKALDLSNLRRGRVKVFTSMPSLAYLAILQSFIILVMPLINQRYTIVFFLYIVLRTLFLTLLQAFQSAVAQVSLQSLLHFQAYYISALYSTSKLGYIRSQIAYLRINLAIEDRMLYTTRVATSSTSSIIYSGRISSRQKLVKRATLSIFFYVNRSSKGASISVRLKFVSTRQQSKEVSRCFATLQQQRQSIRAFIIKIRLIVVQALFQYQVFQPSGRSRVRQKYVIVYSSQSIYAPFFSSTPTYILQRMLKSPRRTYSPRSSSYKQRSVNRVIGFLYRRRYTLQTLIKGISRLRLRRRTVQIQQLQVVSSRSQRDQDELSMRLVINSATLAQGPRRTV